MPFASNLATAEMLVLGLARGDLDWRDIVNPQEQALYGLTTICKSHTIGDATAMTPQEYASSPPAQERVRHRLKARRGKSTGEDSAPAGMETSTARSP